MPKGDRAIQSHVQIIKTFSHFCVKEGLLKTDPLASLELPKAEKRIPETFGPDQLRAIIREIEARPMKTRNLAMLYFFLASGVRVSELCGLRTVDLDIRGRKAKVFGKGSKERIVTFDPVTAKLILKYRAERGESDVETFFLSRDGGELTRNAVRQLFHKIGVAAGVDGVRVSPHTARHTFATAFLTAHPGALFHLQEKLGHEDLQMSRRYARVVMGGADLEGPTPIQTLGIDRVGR